MGAVNNSKYEFVYLLVYIYEDFYTHIRLSMWLYYLHNYLSSYISMHLSISSSSSSSSSRSVPWPVRSKNRCRVEHLANLHLHISFEILRFIHHCTEYLGRVNRPDPIFLQVKPQSISAKLKARLGYGHVSVDSIGWTLRHVYWFHWRKPSVQRPGTIIVLAIYIDMEPRLTHFF